MKKIMYIAYELIIEKKYVAMFAQTFENFKYED